MLSLEDTLDVRSVQMTDMRPFEEQIAGHGIVDGKILLKHPDGRVLKPVQPPPKGGKKKNTLDVNESSARIEITGKRIEQITAKRVDMPHTRAINESR